jgi:predicted dehydrogenase
MGGVEADCELRVRLANSILGIVELSRIRSLKNVCVIQGERATLEVSTGFNAAVQLRMNGRDMILSGQAQRSDGFTETFTGLFSRQLSDFRDSVISGRDPLIPGPEGKRVVELIEACYKSRNPGSQPWLTFHSTVAGASR